jgi:hypothetical protein
MANISRAFSTSRKNGLPRVHGASHSTLRLVIIQSLHTGLIRGLDIFFIVHVFAHILLFKHPKNQFKSLLSWMIIFGCGMAGCLDLIVGF